MRDQSLSMMYWGVPLGALPLADGSLSANDSKMLLGSTMVAASNVSSSADRDRSLSIMYWGVPFGALPLANGSLSAGDSKMLLGSIIDPQIVPGIVGHFTATFELRPIIENSGVAIN